MEIPNLPMHAYGHMGEKTGKQPGSQQKQQWSQILLNSENRGESLAKCWKQGSERPNPPTHSYRHRGGVSGEHPYPPGETAGPDFFHKWEIGGNPRQIFGRQVRCAPLPPVGIPYAGTLYRLLPPHIYWNKGGWPWQNLGCRPYATSSPWGHTWHILDRRVSPSQLWIAQGGWTHSFSTSTPLPT